MTVLGLWIVASLVMGVVLGAILTDQILSRNTKAIIKSVIDQSPSLRGPPGAMGASGGGPTPADMRDQEFRKELARRWKMKASIEEWHINTSAESLTITEFEEDVFSTVASNIFNHRGRWFNHITNKLTGEAGEFAEHVGKAARDDDWDMIEGGSGFTVERRMALLKELGDVLWYIVTLARELNSSLAEVMYINIMKRMGRKQRGTLKGNGDDR